MDLNGCDLTGMCAKWRIRCMLIIRHCASSTNHHMTGECINFILNIVAALSCQPAGRRRTIRFRSPKGKRMPPGFFSKFCYCRSNINLCNKLLISHFIQCKIQHGQMPFFALCVRPVNTLIQQFHFIFHWTKHVSFL